MEFSPRVSCVMIFLNAEAYFVEAIESVFAQTFGAWELLLVDDGSSDGSTGIAKAYAAKHPGRVRYFEHEGHQNRGMSASRNVGLANARGEYVALLDADDVWLPEKLAMQVVVLDARPDVAMTFDTTREWHSWSKDEYKPHDRDRKLGVSADTLVPPPRMFERYLKAEAETPGTCSLLFRRDVARRIGGFEESFKGMFEDQAFIYKLCLEYPVFVSAGQTALYRQHAQSACHRAEAEGAYDSSNQFNPSLLAFLRWLAGHVRTRLAVRRSPARQLERRVKAYVLLWLPTASPRTPKGTLNDDFLLFLSEPERGLVPWVLRKLGRAV